MKQGLGKDEAEEMFHNSLFGATTNASQDFNPSRYHTVSKQKQLTRADKSITTAEDTAATHLPAITRNGGKGSPFKGFKDISIVTQKLRKDIHSQDGTSAFNRSHFEFGSEAHQRKKDAFLPEPELGSKPKATRFASKDKQVQMSSKVLENWIDETLQDAEHLDIPGVILTPENKLPITRYGIDRQSLIKANVDPTDIDRVYRALFVYSVGFYELIKKVFAHTEKKYTTITAIWKVFAILLEYCCRTDYKLMIQAIWQEHKEDLDRLEKEYQKKFNEQAQNEQVRKENNDALQKYCEELQRELTNERQLRQKIEEDYSQNTKNHEEEVQLRLKFESKLNNMHSAHRELETKYKRVLADHNHEKRTNKLLDDKINARNEEISLLKTTLQEHEGSILQDKEIIAALQRELSIKTRQVKDMEVRTARAQAELEDIRVKYQDQQKDQTELKLRLDVSSSTISGLESEKSHLTIEVKELRELNTMYENKTKQLMHDLQETTCQLQLNKREMIGFNEVNKEREDRLAKLKVELTAAIVKADEKELAWQTLSIRHKKVEEQLAEKTREYDDVVDKLHRVTKARHELENQLRDEVERNKQMQDVLKIKDETLDKRIQDIDDLEKKLLDSERTRESIEIKRQGVERAFEMTKKQLNEKIASLQEAVAGEKETRDMWIERYEKESRERTQAESALLQAKSEVKDMSLNVKNGDIKLTTAQRMIQMLQEQNKKFQHETNEAIARAEGLDRELITQKEILKQMEATKNEYIERMQRELDEIEEKFLHIVNINAMMGEDYRSQGVEAFDKQLKLEADVAYLNAHILKLNDQILNGENLAESLNELIRNHEMQHEEDLTRFNNLLQGREWLQAQLVRQSEELDERAKTIKQHVRNEEIRQEAKDTMQHVFTQTIIGQAYFDQKKASGAAGGVTGTLGQGNTSIGSKTNPTNAAGAKGRGVGQGAARGGARAGARGARGSGAGAVAGQDDQGSGERGVSDSVSPRGADGVGPRGRRRNPDDESISSDKRRMARRTAEGKEDNTSNIDSSQTGTKQGLPKTSSDNPSARLPSQDSQAMLEDVGSFDTKKGSIKSQNKVNVIVVPQKKTGGLVVARSPGASPKISGSNSNERVFPAQSENIQPGSPFNRSASHQPIVEDKTEDLRTTLDGKEFVPLQQTIVQSQKSLQKHESKKSINGKCLNCNVQQEMGSPQSRSLKDSRTSNQSLPKMQQMSRNRSSKSLEKQQQYSIEQQTGIPYENDGFDQVQTQQAITQTAKREVDQSVGVKANTQFQHQTETRNQAELQQQEATQSFQVVEVPQVQVKTNKIIKVRNDSNNESSVRPILAGNSNARNILDSQSSSPLTTLSMAAGQQQASFNSPLQPVNGHQLTVVNSQIDNGLQSEPSIKNTQHVSTQMYRKVSNDSDSRQVNPFQAVVAPNSDLARQSRDRIQEEQQRLFESEQRRLQEIERRQAEMAQQQQQRQQEINQLQQQAQRQPKGPTSIRKLIMSANTRE